MDGVRFSEKIRIKENAEIVFDFTQDYKNRLSWDTFLIRAELIGDTITADKGVKAYCVARNKIGMKTEYVTFNRPKVTAIKMTKGHFMFKNFLGSWTFKGLGHLETEVTFLYSFQLRFPFYIFTKLVKRKLKNNVRQRLMNLKTCIENQHYTQH